MKEEYLAAGLTGAASKVLLALLLLARSSQSTNRKREAKLTRAEFASRAGVEGQSIPSTLLQLAEVGLIEIIPQEGRPCLVQLSFSFCGIVPEGDTTETVPPQEALDVQSRCRLADEQALTDAGKGRKAQIEALQAVWDEAFPEEDYPYQRLTSATAKKFLANGRTALSVCETIMDAKEHAKGRIQAPRAYVETALTSADRAMEERDVPVITDDLRRLVEIGRNQFHAKDK